MLFFKVVTSFCLAALASARAAPVSHDSPRGAVYEATFTQHGNIRGSIRFYTVNGYVRYYINVSGLPSRGGPFMYHVHERRVPSSGDCAATLGHFNPFNGVLNARTPAEYEVGDLSGKHGLIRTTRYRRTFDEVFASLNPRNPAFIGALSIVIHLNDGTRIACANLRRVSASIEQTPEAIQAGPPHDGAPKPGSDQEGTGMTHENPPMNNAAGNGTAPGNNQEMGSSTKNTEDMNEAGSMPDEQQREGEGAGAGAGDGMDINTNGATNNTMNLGGSRLSKFVT